MVSLDKTAVEGAPNETAARRVVGEDIEPLTLPRASAWLDQDDAVCVVGIRVTTLSEMCKRGSEYGLVPIVGVSFRCTHKCEHDVRCCDDSQSHLTTKRRGAPLLTRSATEGATLSDELEVMLSTTPTCLTSCPNRTEADHNRRQ